MPSDDPKMRNLIASALKCLQCEICHNETSDVLHGLCSNHMFCKMCVENNSNCPTCNTIFTPKFAEVSLDLGPEFLSALHSLEVIFKAKEPVEKTPKKKAPPKFAPPTPFPDDVPSPAKSDISFLSTSARGSGRRSVTGSPMPDVNKRNKKGESLLHVACIKNNFEEVQRLLILGANCCVRDYNGWTPLHEAVQRNRIEIAQKLLEYGAKVNAAGGEEYLSPLHDAVSAGFTEMVSLLIKFGADPKQISIKGETPKDMSKDPTILSLLQKAETEPVTPPHSEISISDSALFADGRPLVLMSSGLDKAQKATLSSFLKVFSAKVSTKPSADVKVVISAEENNLCQRSAAVLAGIAAGAWIVRPDWLTNCLEQKHLVNPASYELYSTVGSDSGHVFKKSRINTEGMLPGLFAGCHLFFSNIDNFGSDLNKDSVMQLVKVMGGRVLSRSPDPEDTSSVSDIPFHADRRGPLTKCSHFIIFERGKTKKNFIEFNMQHIKAFEYSWLIGCIEQFQLASP